MDKKETGEYEEEKGTGSEAKKMGNERMGENEEVCPFENILFCPGTLTTVKSPLHRSGLFVLHFHQQIYMRVLPAEMYKLLEFSQNIKLYCTKQSIDFCRFS